VANTLLISHDTGATWRPLVPNAGGAYLVVDASSPRENRRIFIVGGDKTGLWDGAKLTVSKVQDSSWIYGVAYGSTAAGPPVLYTANDYNRNKEDQYLSGGILATHDGGIHWASVNDGLLSLFAHGSFPEFSALGASLFHPQTLYASVYHVNLPNDQKRYEGVVKTSDGGKTWKPVWLEAGTIAPNVRESWLSYRFGPDWADQPLSIGVGPNHPDVVYTTDLGRIMKSADGGKTWDAVYSQGTENGYTTTGLDVTTCYGIHFDPFDAKRMFISYTDIGLFRSEDGGASWVSSTVKGVPRPWLNTTYWVEFDPAVKGKMWAVMSGTHDLPRFRMIRRGTLGMRGGVLLSEDGGKSWKAVVNKGMPEMAATHLLLDPKSPANARTLYVVGMGRGVYKSTDGGENWSARNNGLPAKEPLTWRMSLAPDGTLYVVTIRRSEDGTFGNDTDGALFRSRNGGDSWEKVPLPAGLNGPVSVTVDPKDPARLYLSVWGRYKLYEGIPAPMGGVFLSTDSGKSWANVLDQSRRIYDVTVDPRDPNIVYAAGFESSLYRSSDRGATWRRLGGFNYKDAHRVIPDPHDPSKIYVATFGSSVWHGPAEGDPAAVEDIVSPPSMRFAAKQDQKK
jgi:photosystem II stability/assembly factor-like uncharacterized protein